MKKALVGLLLICLVMLMPTVFANTKTITRINFDPIWVIEDYPQKKDIKAPEGVKIVGYTWLDKEEKRFMAADETYKPGRIYVLRMFFEPDEGYEFGDNLTVMVNGLVLDKELVKEPSQYKFEYERFPYTEEEEEEARKEYEAYIKEQEEREKERQQKEKEENEHPLKRIDVQVDIPEAGERLAEKCKIKTNLTDKYVEYEVGKKADDGFYPYWDTNFFPGKAYGNITYTFRVKLFDDTITPKQSQNIEGYINDEECYGGRNKDGSINLFISYKTGEMPPEEPKEVIIAFNFTIDAPKVGEKPSQNAKEVFDGYKATKVVWTPNDKVFEAGKEYKVEIFYKIEDGYTYFGEIKTWINNKEVIEQGWDEDHYLLIMDKLCAEYTFPKLEDEVEETKPEETKPEETKPEDTKPEATKKVEWTKASNWAIEELNKANEKELVPQIFEKQDLTTNITRKEFAHIVVKLWEALAGKTVEVGTQNPFTDTDDAEVLKAYNLEITKGTTDTTFSPDALITREQMATMMTRALSKAGIDVSVDLDKVEKFADDNEIHSWGKEAVYYMSNLEIIKGIGNNTFGVKGDATREQSLVISLRSIEKMGK